MMNHSNIIENHHSILLWYSLGGNLSVIKMINLFTNQMKRNYNQYFGNGTMNSNKTINI